MEIITHQIIYLLNEDNIRLGVWLRHLCIVLMPMVPKGLEYSSMAAPIYTSWGIDTDTYYGKKFDTLVLEYDG